MSSQPSAEGPAPLPERPRAHAGYLAGVCFIAALGGFLFGFDTAVISGTVGYLKKQFALGALMEGWVVTSALKRLSPTS